MRTIAIAAVLFLLGLSAGSGGAAQRSSSATRTSGGFGEVDSISCAATGECAAGGYYLDGRGHGRAFVVSQTNGSWGAAREVPGTAGFNSVFGADVDSISC